MTRSTFLLTLLALPAALGRAQAQGMALCKVCRKSALPQESVKFGGNVYHKQCFRCSLCNTTLQTRTAVIRHDKLYCATHAPKPVTSPG